LSDPQEAEHRAQIFELLHRLAERRNELAPPLATITERDGKPAEIRFLREPTPEERARLRAAYPDAVEVEARETVLVW
jgi:uncharacterized coiled-coil DUF342 family protein